MLRAVLCLRFLMLIGSAGALFGAALMFWQGSAKILAALRAVATPDGASSTVAIVMSATDIFLFGVVLMIFAYAIAFGLAFELSPEERERLPRWARIEGVHELKRTLIEVILVYLVVDFATDVAESGSHQRWDLLSLPVGVFLIAGALRLMGGAHRSEESSSSHVPGRWSRDASTDLPDRPDRSTPA